MKRNRTKTEGSILVYVPFLNFEDSHFSKAPWQIPLHFRKRGYETTLVVGSSVIKQSREGVKIEVTDHIDWQRPSDHFRDFFQLVHLINICQPSIVISFGLFPVNILLALVFRVLSPKKIFGVSHGYPKFILKLDSDGTIPLNGFPKMIYTFIIGIARLLVKKLTIESNCAFEEFPDVLGIKKKMEVVPNSYSETLYSKKGHDTPGREKIILAVSRITRIKSLETLLHAFQNANEAIHDWNLRIVGPVIDKGYYDELVKLTEKLKLSDRVTFPGEKLGSELEEEYGRATIFCHTSIRESFAIVRLEAIVNGLPVITTESACGKHLPGAIAVPVGNSELLAHYIKQLVSNKEMRVKLVEEGQSKLVGWEKISGQFVRIAHDMDQSG